MFKRTKNDTIESIFASILIVLLVFTFGCSCIKSSSTEDDGKVEHETEGSVDKNQEDDDYWSDFAPYIDPGNPQYGNYVDPNTANENLGFSPGGLTF